MTSLSSVYEVISVMVSLMLPILLGYGSVKWWKIIEPQHCDSINKLVYFFTMPIFIFDFTHQIDPTRLDYKFIGAEAISKGVIVVGLAIWQKFTNVTFSWSITYYSLATMNNALFIEIPLMKAMYGEPGKTLVLQSDIVQVVIWTSILLFVLEIRHANLGNHTGTTNRKEQIETRELDMEGGNDNVPVVQNNPTTWKLMKTVLVKLAKNPNIYSCVLGVIWALLSNRWHIRMPVIVEYSIAVMSKAGAGTSMFSVGLFMALQEKLISCGLILTILGMVLRFIVGPVAMAIGASALGLRGDALRVAIIQAALPQSVSSFVVEKEYGLHTQVISTAVIFGTMASLPILILFYIILNIL